MSDQPKISRDELAQMLLYSAKNLFTANGKDKGLVSHLFVLLFPLFYKGVSGHFLEKKKCFKF